MVFRFFALFQNTQPNFSKIRRVETFSTLLQPVDSSRITVGALVEQVLVVSVFAPVPPVN